MDGDNKPEAVVVSAKKRFSLFRRTIGKRQLSKQNRLIACGVVLLLAGGIVAWQLWPEKKPAPKADIKQTFESSSKLINQGQYNAAQRELNNFIDSSAPEADKVEAKMALANVLVAKKEFDQALVAFVEVDRIKDDLGYTNYSTMYGLYEKKGDRVSAIKYLKKAIESIKKTPEPTDDIYLAQYEHKLKTLEQQ